MSELLEVLDRLVAQARPAEGLEAYGVDRTQTSVRAHDGDVESLSRSRTRGVGVRVLSEGAFGYAHTTDLSEAALFETLEAARANAAAATAEEANVLADAADARPLEGIYDPEAEHVATAEKVDIALALEAAVRRAGEPVKGADSVIYGDGIGEQGIASTAGIRATARASEAFCLAEALCESDGATTSAYGVQLARHPRHLDIDSVAAEAVTRASRLLGGRKPSSARLPILLDPQVTAELLSVLAGALTAEAAQRGRSLFAGRLGERLAPDFVTLVDDGRHPDGPASAPRDGEGVPTQRTLLLDGGVLTGFLHDVRSARREGTTSTGNAVRAGHHSPPTVGASNCYLEPGELEPRALFDRAGEGFFCQQVMGLHSGANPASGEVSVGATGLMVRDGQLAEPVREATIAGTIPDLLAGVLGVGADFRFVPVAGGMGGQTVLVDGMRLSGS